MYRLFSIIVLTALASCRHENIIHPYKKDIVETVYASGKIFSGNEYNAYALSSGTIIKKMVKEGDTVTRGQILYVIKYDGPAARLDAARSSYNNAQSNLSRQSRILNDLRLSMQNAETRFANDSLQYIRLKRLMEQGIGMQSNLDNAAAMAGAFIRNMLTYVVSFTLLVVAGFGIYNIMTMTINSKMKDIAILKAQGFARKDIVQIFLSQSLIIGFIGALTGIALGYILSYSLSRVPFPENEEIAWKFFPVLFKPGYYFFGVLFGVITTFFAGFLPSVKASRVDPVAILRG